ncbi:MAG: M20/M25/M40 family metallo-hydrolase [Pseudomonadales bacterium]|nr:M20/M25/M40 family metallo-hydrolase [Pseudomonadales bacterium]
MHQTEFSIQGSTGISGFWAFAVSAILALNTLFVQAQTGIPVDADIQQNFQRLSNDARVQAALRAIAEQEPETIAEQIRLTEIPAPPFMEQRRAEYYLEQMKARGLADAYIDAEGNVVGIRRGVGDGPLFAIAAHLDTVFPPETDTRVELRNGRYYAPGISDDGRGLAVLLRLIETLNASGLATTGDIMFIGNVGEEGRGDLRGIKAIFRDHPDIDGFVSIDGSGLTRITTGGTGSRRFEFHFSGPGGHSFGAFGLVSAIHAMGRAIARIADMETPADPKTTFTVGTVSGGTSVNSIAADAMFALDMRSNDAAELALLETRIKEAAREAVAEENARWNNNGNISVDFRLIGDRPVGLTASENPLVQAAALAFAGVNIELQGLGISSTDSNVPMALGIPAITIGGGGQGGGAHSPEEWFEPVESHRGPQLALLLTLALTGVPNLAVPALELIPPHNGMP